MRKSIAVGQRGNYIWIICAGDTLIYGIPFTEKSKKRLMLPTCQTPPSYRMPPEDAPHAATWMQWPHQTYAFGCADLLTAARRHIARLACTIATFEKVIMLAHPDDAATARASCGQSVDILPLPVDNMWARDSAPTFVLDANGQLAAADFNFNGWGKKDTHDLDSRIVVRVCEHLGIERVDSALVSEGGAWDTDGLGTFLSTESAVLNANRNPGLGKADVFSRMQHAVGAKKIIWFPGIEGEDITDAHVDGLARFVRPGWVLVESAHPTFNPVQAKIATEARAILAASTDAQGQPINVVDLQQAAHLRPNGAINTDFYSGYINYYVCNGAVIMPQFGDIPADASARDVIADLYPDRQIVQLDVDNICAYGGSIHCVTQQQPLTK